MAWEGINQKWVIAMHKWREGREGDDLVRLTKETLRVRFRVELCEYIKALTKMVQSRMGALQENGKEGTEWHSKNISLR